MLPPVDDPSTGYSGQDFLLQIHPSSYKAVNVELLDMYVPSQSTSPTIAPELASRLFILVLTKVKFYVACLYFGLVTA